MARNGATVCVLVLCTLGSVRSARGGPHGNRQSRASADAAQPIRSADARLANQIFDAVNPFPVEHIRSSTPIAWKLSCALGRAASLHPSCVYVHMLLLIALTLNAVVIKYSGLLGRFCNLLLLQHGPPGDGKSVALWLSQQILAYYDKKRDAFAAKLHREEYRLYAEAKREAETRGEAPPEAPSKHEPKDSLYVRGTFVGLGQHMKHQDGVAFLALHEGRTWLPETFQGGPGGGVEDLNQLHDHDVYKNSPANTSGKFVVRNPHLVGAVLLHLDELVSQAEKDDSVAGMERFLIARFPMVANKLLPTGAAEEVGASILEGDYFNDLTYDAVVKCMAHVLLVTQKLFPKDAKRADSDARPGSFSEVTGLHAMSWDSCRYIHMHAIHMNSNSMNALLTCSTCARVFARACSASTRR